MAPIVMLSPEESMLRLETLDSDLKGVTRELISIQDKKLASEDEMSGVKSTARTLFEEYETILEKVLLTANEEYRERLDIKKDQLKVTRESYRRNLMLASKSVSHSSRSTLFATPATNLRKRNVNNSKAIQDDVNNSLEASVREMAKAQAASQQMLMDLQSDADKMDQTKKSAKDMSGDIDEGDQLLTKYARRERTDKILIYLGIFTFFTTVIYILLKRIFGFFL